MNSQRELSVMYLEQEIENTELRLLESIWSLESAIRGQLKILANLDAKLSQLTSNVNKLTTELSRNET